MTLPRILAICKAYDKLGWAVVEQLDDVMANNVEQCNFDALKLLLSFGETVKKHADANGDDELYESAQEFLDTINNGLPQELS